MRTPCRGSQVRSVWYIIYQGYVYRATRSTDHWCHKHEKEVFECLADCLVGQPEGQLHGWLDVSKKNWKKTEDIINPLDHPYFRLVYDSVWIVDFDKDVLAFIKKASSGVVPMAVARKRFLSAKDFKAWAGFPSYEVNALTTSTWELQTYMPEPVGTFLVRILRDFYFVWQHFFLRCHFDVFNQLAMGVLRLASLDFRLEERVGRDPDDYGGRYVDALDSPLWDAPIFADLVKVGRCWFAVSEDLEEAMEMIKEHVARNPDPNILYAAYTLREIVFCSPRQTLPGALRHTAIETIFDGQNFPSEKGLEMLIWAVWGSSEQPRTKLNQLPREIQDKIVEQLDMSPLATAKLSCELGIGTKKFDWKDKNRPIRLQLTKTGRAVDSVPIESLLYFGDYMSGLSYKGNPTFSNPPGSQVPDDFPYWLHVNACSAPSTPPSIKKRTRA